MQRKLISIFLVVSMLATLVRFTVPYIWYHANYDYIVTELCENRHNPEVECNGYCLLSKKLNNSNGHGDHKQSEQAPQRTNINHLLSINLFYGDGFSFPFKAPLTFTSEYWLKQVDIFSMWYGDIITPPPQQV